MNVSILFTGHMIDMPDRAIPRFPPSLERAACQRIAQAIAPFCPIADRTGAGHPVSSAVGFASGARGGDILFHEACRRRGIDTVIVLPFEAEAFVKSSVKIDNNDAADWPHRFWTLWEGTPIANRHVLALPASREAYAICNTHLLELARSHGRVHLVAMWDGKVGGEPGGAADLIAKARHDDDTPDVFSPVSLRG